MTIKRYQPGHRMSQAVAAGGLLFIGGQVAEDETRGIEGQTRDVLDQIDALLAEGGTAKSRLVSVNVYLADIADFDAMNSVYDGWVDAMNPPVRACVEARLADPNLRVEMTAVALL